MKAIKSGFCSLMACAMIFVLCMPATAASYQKIADVYMAEKFLADDTRPANMDDNLNRYIGISQSPALGLSYLDKEDKKQGSTSLAQKASKGGAELGFWLGPDKFSPEMGGAPVNVAAYSNPALHLWIFFSNVKNIGGDPSTKDEAYGSFQVDICSGSTGTVNPNASRNFWILADDLSDGWNEIVIPVKPATNASSSFTFDKKTFGFIFSSAFDFSNINWFRINIRSKGAMLVKIDDIYFCDLGDTPGADTSTPPPAPVSSAETQPTVSSANSQSGQNISEAESAGVSDASDDLSDLSDSVSDTSSASALENDDDQDGINGFLIAGIILGVLAIAGIAAGVLLYIRSLKKKIASGQE